MKKALSLLTLCLLSAGAFADNYIVGKLAPEKQVEVRSEVSGIVDSYQVDSGDAIKQGAPLLSISQQDYTLEADLAKYDLAVKKAERDMQEKQLIRYQSLFKKHGISEGDYENQLRLTHISRAEQQRSQTQYAIAQRTLTKAMPNAPFDGVVALRAVEVGQFISVGDALYTLADIHTLKVRFHVLESDFDPFHKGDTVQVTIPADAQTVTGTVSLFSPVMADNDPGFLVEVTIDNAQRQWLPGMEAYVHVNEHTPTAEAGQ
ncbi:efflux RND transporter periplasmic adaptor subunit [Photobacterium aphoticum]|uniref:RND transporter n=1 Tax=Photobacterium aphoticum TaxID=754436 RepID=A0A0J1GL29_9GAMM|nr:efflux RND transporter periplasmic adaptor subunit [Photobacterium aphoticum]KLV00164.1 RND transporter [Photobacterium aphoticum]PSU57170.1 efflux RND transporter periplasmic adaptor subunit [Photobacterium aphoticum]GHA56441.1 hypothetical protein GCM10007086_33120 [Photobacterium aphoticum]